MATQDVLPASGMSEAAPRREWIDHAARTTAVLAILAAVSSGQYANQFSRTILAQAEASDQWSYYQSKSIKRHLVQGQVELLQALAATQPAAAAELAKLGSNDSAAVKKYDAEIVEIRSKAEKIEADKRLHERQGNWFQSAFIILQAGGGRCPIPSRPKRRGLGGAAIAFGVAGLVVVGYGFMLGLHPPA